MIVALLQVQHQGVLELQVPSDHTSVADIIQVLEEMKDGGVIQNYSVSQTTLDDVRLQSLFDIIFLRCNLRISELEIKILLNIYNLVTMKSKLFCYLLA